MTQKVVTLYYNVMVYIKNFLQKIYFQIISSLFLKIKL
jgi:hypothetical protein